jgi:hypothetical protein
MGDVELSDVELSDVELSDVELSNGGWNFQIVLLLELSDCAFDCQRHKREFFYSTSETMLIM